MLIQGSQAVTRPAAMRGSMLRALLNRLLVTFGFAIAVIVPPRAWSFGRGWIMIGLFLVFTSAQEKELPRKKSCVPVS